MNPLTPRRTNSNCKGAFNGRGSHNSNSNSTPTSPRTTGSTVSTGSTDTMISIGHPSPNHHMGTTTNSSATSVTIIRFPIICILLINSILFSLYGSAATLTPFTTTIAMADDTLEANLSDQQVVDEITTDASVTARIRRRISSETDPMVVVPSRTLQKRSILVTGAAGFVGSHVVEYLLQHQQQHQRNIDDEESLYDIVVIDEVNEYYDTTIKESNLELLTNLSSSLSNQSPISLHIYRGDICNTTLLDLIFTQHNIVSICHMAARAGVRPSIENPYVYIHSNIIGTLTLLQYAVQYQIQNFVFASSSSVYGGSTSTYFTETEAVDHPISPYAATKKSCELFAYMYAYQHQLNVTALRFFTVYGPRGRPDMAPYKFIHAISNHIPIQQYGDGTSSRDYTYISDIVSGVVKSLIDHPSRYSIYNLGKGNGTTLNDFVHYVEKFVNTSATIQLLPDQPGDVPYTCANITMAQEDLQYQPMVPFPSGIQKTVQWYQQRQAQLIQLSPVSSSNGKRNISVRRRLSQQQLPTVATIQFDDEMMDPISTDSIQHQRYKTQRRRRLKQDSSLNQREQNSVVAPMEGHKKIAMSGAISANPFVGRHVVEALLLRCDDVVLIDDDDDIDDITTSTHAALSDLQRKYLDADPDGRDATSLGRLSIHLGNRNNSTFLEIVFHEEQPTHVCHFGLDKYALSPLLSTVYDDELERSRIYVQKNVEILVRLLEVSRSGGKMTTNVNGKSEGTRILNDEIQNFIFTSSDAVYGYEAASTKKDGSSTSTTSSTFGEHVLWNETNRVDYPKSSYGASMKTAELVGYTYHHLYNIPISVLRLFNIYGPHQTQQTTGPSYQLFDMFVKVKENEEASEATMSDQNLWDTFDFGHMDYSYIDDTVQGIVSSIDRPYEYEIFNLGGGNDNCIDGITNLIHAISIELSLPEEQTKKILKDFQDSLSLKGELLVDGIACADIQKASALLQYIPDKSTVLQSYSLKRTIEWHRQQDSIGLLAVTSTLPNQNVVTQNAPINQTIIHAPLNEAIDSKMGLDSTNSNATKLCSTGVIVLLTNHPNYPQWLRQLAFMQWLIVVLILLFRFCYRLRGGSGINGPSSNPLSSSQQQQLLSINIELSTQNKEGRISPRRERL